MFASDLKKTALFAGPLAGLVLGIWCHALLDNMAAASTAGITLCCALWWMSEALPLPATALLPLALFPLLGILTPAEVAGAYGNSLILLFLGGFLLSRAMEVTQAHRHLALHLVHRVGAGERRLIFGFLLASAGLSMWISNTATALMLLPIALAVIDRIGDARKATAILLALAYGASIGGLATPIGSPPNLVFMKVYQDTTGTDFSFIDWMGYGLPVVAIFLPVAGLWLARGIRNDSPVRLPDPGPWTSSQRRVLLIFGLTALAWITRQDPWGGWSHWLNLPHANDASVALLGALSLFIVNGDRQQRLLNWEQAAAIPWGMLILFGGGIAIATAFASSGLSDALGGWLAGLLDLPTLLLLLGLSLAVTFITEINSNTATAALLMPVLAGAAMAADMDPMLLMLPAALSASCAFMLPVATPPNAVVFGSGRLHIRQMVHHGLMLNLIGAMIITSCCWLLLAR